ncbi:MAG: hypothetical protein ONB27_14595 [candidate division KSB1 bacterium]|nr:hypothetical protein [candidate division KSB1 bacterium]
MRAIKTKFTIVIFLFLLPIILCHTILAQEEKEKKGKIEQFEKELEEDNSDSTISNDNQEGGSVLSNLLGEILFDPKVLLYLFIGSSDNEDTFLGLNFWNSYFSDFPYQSRNVGLYASPEIANKRFSMKLFGNYFYNSTDLQGFDFRARICPLPFLGAALDFTELNEDLGATQDNIQIYNIFLNYYRGRSQHLALWWGLGAKGIAGDKTRHAFAINIGTEIYPIKPISFHFNYNIGLMNDNAVGELLLHLNFHIQRSIVFVGYHRYSVGTAILDGAIGGIGIYL